MTDEEKAALNRERVKKSMEKKDRINIILPKGTIDRIKSYGFNVSSFVRELVLNELDKMDKIKSNDSRKEKH